MMLSRFQDRSGRASRWGRAVAILGAALVFVLGLLAASPDAHEFFHKDAGHEDHECVVTAFAVGEGLFVAPYIDLRPEAGVIARLQIFAPEFIGGPTAVLLPPACGPPALPQV